MSRECTLSIRLLWPFARLTGTSRGAATALRHAGVDAADFANPDARVPHRAVVDLLALTVAVTGDASLGIRAAEITEPGDLDVLEYAARGCASLGEAFVCSARYFRLVNDAAEVRLVEQGHRALVTYRVTDGIAEPSAAVDFVIVGLLHFARRNAPLDETGWELWFEHDSPAYAGEYVRVFRGPVRFTAPYNAIVMPSKALATPMLRAEPRLARAFQLRAQYLLDQLKRGDGTSGRVRELVAQHLGSGQVTMEWAARRLAMSVPTLRRHLATEGATFRGMVDEVRRHLAEDQLRKGASSLSEVAFLLGFSSLGAFDRAFKRWTGAAPAEYRTRVHRR